jgi:hypothetical protein
MRTSRAIKQFGTWAVTTYGVESLTMHYPIARDRLNECEAEYTWEQHMADKNWVNMDDFREAMDFARKHFKTKGG